MKVAAGVIAGVILTRYLDRARWWRRTLWWIFGNGA